LAPFVRSSLRDSEWLEAGLVNQRNRRGRIRLADAVVAAIALLLVAALYWRWGYEPTDPAFGRFEGQVVGIWDDNGRDMTLEREFVYVDPRGQRWVAPAGSVVNGASIPQAFWSMIGGPFSGRFRNASVIHDVACEERTESWEDVHRMFYEACRCGRAGQGKSETMYWAVYHFGPRWNRVFAMVVGEDGEVTMPRSVPVAVAPPDADVVERAAAYFSTHAMSAEEIESFTPEQLAERP
jgi:hypothetical protein